MKVFRIGVAFAGVLGVTVHGVSAQSIVSVRSATLFETYSYDAGLPFDKVTQISNPVAITAEFGRLGTLAISSGFTSVALNVTDANLGDQDLSGVIDTQVRWTFALVPDRVYAVGSGTIPTGISRTTSDELSILGVLASDIVGFSLPSLGTGGSVGGGLVGAVPLGSWALGLGATFSSPFSYRPVQQNTDFLNPGAEIRIRTGLEGALGRRTYVRMVGVFSSRENGRFGSNTQSVGNRFVGYLSVNQGMGNMTGVFYAFDVFRAGPQSTQGTPLPRGNLLAYGTRLEYPLNPNTTLIPNLEGRISHLAADASATSPVNYRGHSVRAGLSLRHRLSRNFGVVVEGDYLTGLIRDADYLGMTGFLGGIHLEWTP